jgi:hypothetical protein
LNDEDDKLMFSGGDTNINENNSLYRTRRNRLINEIITGRMNLRIFMSDMENLKRDSNEKIYEKKSIIK